MKGSARHIDFIDHLRGIAVLSVFLYHCLGYSYGYYSLPWEWLHRGFNAPASFIALLPIHFAGMGVPIFFAVSGFCIHLSFQQQGQQWQSFFLRRFFRLYPAYAAAVILFAFFYENNNHDLWSQVFYHLLLIHNYNETAFHTINGSFWTIAIEVQLYLIYPLLLWLVARLGWKWTLISLAICEMFLQGWDAALYQIVSFSGNVSPFALHKLSPFVDHYLRPSPLAFWCSWSIGAGVADAYLKSKPMPLAKSSVLFWAILVVAAYYMAFLSPFFFLLSAVLTAKVIGQYLAASGPDVRSANFWLAQLRRIGIWSYSIYLLHEPLIGMFVNVTKKTFPGINPLYLFLCCVSFFVVVMPLSGIWYRLIEQPGIALGKRIIKKIVEKKNIQENTSPTA